MTYEAGKMFKTPQDAEEAFYKAFAQCDIDAMMSIWNPVDYISCIHPMGAELAGPDKIRDSWIDVFANAPAISFEITDQRTIQHEKIVIHTVHEHLHMTHQPTREVQILATNIYEQTENGWFMILHHASPAPKEETSPDTGGPSLH